MHLGVRVRVGVRVRARARVRVRWKQEVVHLGVRLGSWLRLEEARVKVGRSQG